MPAAAVIPAPIAYIKVVAVKKLVVGFWVMGGPVCCRSVCTGFPNLPSGCYPLLFIEWGVQLRIVYFEKIRVFKAGLQRLEYISMG